MGKEQQTVTSAIEKNVASVETAYAWSYRYAVVYFRDGGSKKFDDKLFE